eukprot:734368-Rhodomonas_salina.2
MRLEIRLGTSTVGVSGTAVKGAPSRCSSRPHDSSVSSPLRACLAAFAPLSPQLHAHAPVHHRRFLSVLIVLASCEVASGAQHQRPNHASDHACAENKWRGRGGGVGRHAAV